MYIDKRYLKYEVVDSNGSDYFHPLPSKPFLLILYFLLSITVIFASTGCSIKKIAVNSIADGLTEGGAGVYATDDDPEFVGKALPFSLKTMEALLRTVPKNKKLLVATAAGFVQYGHAYVLRPADVMESINLPESRKERKRAKRLFLRARSYGLRALELGYPGISKQLISGQNTAVLKTGKGDVPALYWTGAAWGSALSAAKNDMALLGDMPIVYALLERAMELDEGWNDGAIHELFIMLAAGRSEAEGGGLKKASAHFERAMELNGGRSISPLVSMAESVCVRQQDRKRFKELLLQALAFDVYKYHENRLANILARQKAEYLLNRIDELFFIYDE